MLNIIALTRFRSTIQLSDQLNWGFHFICNTDTRVQFGKWHGHIQSLVRFWRHVRTIERFASGKRRNKINGQRCLNMTNMNHQVWWVMRQVVGTMFFDFVCAHLQSPPTVNSISWAPHELGLILASGSSDGSIRILKHKGENQWDEKVIRDAHPSGVNAVSWSPAISSGSVINSNVQNANPVKRIVSGGCDNLVKVWR
jgi:WD40 repeat protein